MRRFKSARPLWCASIGLGIVGGASWFSPRPAFAQPAVSDAPWWEQVTLDGFVSSTYSYNFNRPNDRINALHVFDFDDNTFKVDVAELVIQRSTAEPGDGGFRIDVVAGGSIPRVSASAGLFRDSLVGEDIDLQQAYATWIAPLGTGLRFDFGKFITHHGFEVIEGYDAYNDNASRSFLFGFAIPFTHTGAKASYAFGEQISGAVMAVNGWDNARDNNRSKSVGAQLTIVPAGSLSIYLNGMYGPERDNNDRDARTIADVVAIWKRGAALMLGANYDYGTEENAAGPGRDAVWSGIAGYLRLGFGDRVATSLRGELFDDRDGVRTGAIQKLKELTFTPEFHATTHFLLRGDVRVDWSDHDVFDKRGEPTDHQTTMLLDAIYSF